MVALNRPFHNFTDEDAVVDGKKVYIMRPCMIHGPGNKGNLNLLYGVVSKGIPWPLGAFENRRSFTSIGNLQEVIKGFLTKDAPNGIYHMGDDEALSTNELMELICSALGKKEHIWNIPRSLMNGAARGRLAPPAPEHPAHAETHRELRGLQRQDQGRSWHEGDARES